MGENIKQPQREASAMRKYRKEDKYVRSAMNHGSLHNFEPTKRDSYWICIGTFHWKYKALDDPVFQV